MRLPMSRAIPRTPSSKAVGLVVNSVAMLFEVAEKTGSEQLSNEMYNYLSMAIYKVFRYLYAAIAALRKPSARQASTLTACAMRT